MLEQLIPFISGAYRKERPVFVQDFPHPVFVVEAFAKGEDGEAPSIHTVAQQQASSGASRSVGKIRKREGANAFGMMVTIGRANNNDIVIPARDVSKFHAYVRFVDGKAHLTDAGSTYGTFVGDKKLAAREEQASLGDGAKVRLGESVTMTYYSPGAFHEFLRHMDDDQD